MSPSALPPATLDVPIVNDDGAEEFGAVRTPFAATTSPGSGAVAAWLQQDPHDEGVSWVFAAFYHRVDHVRHRIKRATSASTGKTIRYSPPQQFHLPTEVPVASFPRPTSSAAPAISTVSSLTDQSGSESEEGRVVNKDLADRLATSLTIIGTPLLQVRGGGQNDGGEAPCSSQQHSTESRCNKNTDAQGTTNAGSKKCNSQDPDKPDDHGGDGPRKHRNRRTNIEFEADAHKRQLLWMACLFCKGNAQTLSKCRTFKTVSFSTLNKHTRIHHLERNHISQAQWRAITACKGDPALTGCARIIERWNSMYRAMWPTHIRIPSYGEL